MPTSEDDLLNYARRLVAERCIYGCLLYTSDAADERSSVDLGGRRIIKKKTINRKTQQKRKKKKKTGWRNNDQKSDDSITE